MKKSILFCIILLLRAGAWVCAQDSYTDRAMKYIEKYSPLAIEEQRRSGVPASITLGQGILETEAGASELMTKANNHFGIKCKSDYGGDKFFHTDDAPNECFKSYKCAEESYKDHSDYLKRNPRYGKLFTLKTTDYKSWAVCLKNCGYATNPQYAQSLIKIIDNFNLQNYTYSALDSSLLSNGQMPAGGQMPVGSVEFAEMTEDGKVIYPNTEANTTQKKADSARNISISKKNEAPLSAAPAGADSNKIVTVNGMKAFYARKGEMLLQYAVKYKIRYPRLLEMNDLPDAPLPFNTCVYLEKKQTLGTHPTHIVKEGENILLVSMIEGVQLKKLMAMNMLNPNEEPVPGSVLYLQSASAMKPEVNVGATEAHKNNAIVTGPDTVAKMDDDFIAIKPKPEVKPVVKTLPKAVDTIVKHKEAPVAVNIPKPQPVIVETPKPPVVAANHVIVVSTPVEEPRPKPVVQTPVPEKPALAIEKRDATTEEEFTKLKAELDRVVYADDSKLIAKMEPPQVPQKPVAEQAPKSAKYYIVKKGETAFSIAKKNNITLAELLKWNNITASGVKAGKNLRVK